MKKKRAFLLTSVLALLTLVICLPLTSCQSKKATKKLEKKIIGKSGLAMVAEEPLENIIKRSKACAIGKVVEISPTRLSSEENKYFEDVLAYRNVTIEVEEYLFNKANLGKEITLAVLGGQIKLPEEAVIRKGFSKGTKVVRVFEDEAQFEIGERVLVFIGKGTIGYKNSDGSETTKERLALVGAWQGKFRVEGEEAKNYLPNRNKKLDEIRSLINQINP